MITIIVLLILAGVALNFVIGENGILKHAEFASNKYQNSAEKEENELAQLDSYISASRDTVIIDKNEYNELKKQIEQLKTQNTISQTEHYTGEYYYNGKPIYEKSIYLSSLPNTTIVTYNHGIENVDVIWVDLQNSFIYGSNSTTPFTYMNPTDSKSHYDISGVSNSSFNICTGYDRTTHSALITFRYTKTTDTGNGNTIIPLN